MISLGKTHSHVNSKLIYGVHVLRLLAGAQVRKWERKRIIIDFYEFDIFCGSFFLKNDELFAFIYFESVIMVPKVRNRS